MAFGLPNQPLPMETFGKAFNGMDDFFNKLRQHQMEQQKLAELAKYHGADIGLRKAAAGRAAALAPLQKMLLQAKISHQANLDNPAFKAQQFAALMQKIKEMKGGQRGRQELGAENNMPMPEQEQAYGSGQGMMMPEQMQEGAQQMPQESTEQGSAMDYNDPDVRMAYQSVFGKEMPKPYESPAQKAARDIASKKEVEDYKLSQAAEKAKNTAEGKYQGEAYGQAVDTAVGLGDVEHNLEYIKTKIEEDPDAKNVIGPMNQPLTKYFGSDKDKQLLGGVMSATGNIVLDAAKNIKGAFTGRDQTLINSMKPSAGDTYGVFIGKLNAMLELSKLAKERANIYADELHKGTPPHRAIDIARQKTDMAEAGRRGEKQIRMAQYKYDAQMGKNPVFKTKEDQIEFLNSLSDAEKIKLLSHMEAK